MTQKQEAFQSRRTKPLSTEDRKNQRLQDIHSKCKVWTTRASLSEALEVRSDGTWLEASSQGPRGNGQQGTAGLLWKPRGHQGALR